MKNYPVERWHEKAMSNKNMILVNYYLLPRNFEGWIFSHQLFEQLPDNAQNTIYFFKRGINDKDEAIRIDIIESDSIKIAERSFLFLLTDVMAPVEFPEVTDSTSLGVACYKGFSDINSSLMFLRYNLAVRIRSVGQKEISVTEEAKKIDADIMNEPTQNDEKLFQQLNINLLASANEVLKRLESKKENPYGRRVYYKIIAPDHKTELSRNGINTYEPSQPSNIVLYAISEEGYVSRAELK
jgi:hypothetical protein